VVAAPARLIGRLAEACDAGRRDARAGVRHDRPGRGSVASTYRRAWRREAGRMKERGELPQLRIALEHGAECP
jgi:hypothetical protein